MFNKPSQIDHRISLHQNDENFSGDRRRGRIHEVDHFRGRLPKQRRPVADSKGPVSETKEGHCGDDKKVGGRAGFSSNIEGDSRHVDLQRDHRRRAEEHHRCALSGEGGQAVGGVL